LRFGVGIFIVFLQINLIRLSFDSNNGDRVHTSLSETQTMEIE
jgi:hypothetical protein